MTNLFNFLKGIMGFALGKSESKLDTLGFHTLNLNEVRSITGGSDDDTQASQTGDPDGDVRPLP